MKDFPLFDTEFGIASLVLKEDDVGLRIRVRVTGTNGYTGSAVSSFATLTAIVHIFLLSYLI